MRDAGCGARVVERAALFGAFVLAIVVLMVMKVTAEAWWTRYSSWLGLSFECLCLVLLCLGRVRVAGIVAVVFFGGACVVHMMGVTGVVTIANCGCLGAASFRHGEGLALAVGGGMGLLCVRLLCVLRHP
jgi:hypothetical protein